VVGFIFEVVTVVMLKIPKDLVLYQVTGQEFAAVIQADY
jgi:hypothetical protein